MYTNDKTKPLVCHLKLIETSLQGIISNIDNCKISSD